jgi:hypothetical protein
MYKVILILLLFSELCFAQEMKKSCLNKILNSEAHSGIDEFDKLSQYLRVKLVGNQKVKSIICTDFDKDGNEAFRFHYEYNGKGLIGKVKSFYIGNERHNKDEVIKYEGNRIIEQLDIISKDKYIYEYKNNYRLKKLYTHDTGETVLYDSIHYNNEMEIDELTFFSLTKKNVKTASNHIEDGEMVQTSFLIGKEYKVKRYKLEISSDCKSIHLNGKSPNPNIIINYDKYDNVISKVTLNSDNTATLSEQKFEYKLDPHNNWIERYIVAGTSKMLINKRVIEYLN